MSAVRLWEPSSAGAPSGIHNELWIAESDQSLPVGTSVRVVSVKDLVLHVAPEPSDGLGH